MIRRRFVGGTETQNLASLRVLCVLVGFLLCLFLLVGCGSSDDSWERVAAVGVLRVGLDPTYPPFEATDGESVFGFDIDLAEAMAAELGVDVQYVYLGYDGLYDALDTGRVDVLISAMVIVPQRTRDFAYSDPYFDAGEILIVPTTSTVEEMADLANGTLAVELGAQGHVLATEWQRRLPTMDVQSYTTAVEAITAVADGEAAAALVDSISGRLALAEQPTLQWVTPSVRPEPFALVVRVEDEQLLERLNERLQQLNETGELALIGEKWLDS